MSLGLRLEGLGFRVYLCRVEDQGFMGLGCGNYPEVLSENHSILPGPLD